MSPVDQRTHPLATGHSWQNGYVALLPKQRTRAMADLALLAAAGVPPVRMNLPVPLQRPFAADPGTLTEWLVANTADLGRDAVLAVLAAMNAKYANVVDPLITPRANRCVAPGVGRGRPDIRRIGILPYRDHAGRRDADGHFRISIVPIPQWNGTDVALRRKCLWFFGRG